MRDLINKVWDIFGLPFSAHTIGKDAAFDVTVVTPLQDATMPAAANTAGHALNYAYGRKMNGAHEECRRQGIAFLPIVAETFGGWHPEA